MPFATNPMSTDAVNRQAAAYDWKSVAAARDVVTLCAFAIAQPLFVRMVDRTAFFRDSQTDALRISLLTAAILLLPPLVLIAFYRCAGFCHARLGRAAHLGAMSALLGLLALPAVTQIVEPARFQLSSWGLYGSFCVLASLLAAAGVVWLYVHSHAIRRLIGLAAIGVLIFPIVFLSRGAPRDVLSAAIVTSSSHESVAAAPVVVIVCDEFCGMSLLDQNHQIDPVRFPNFARLAATSTWHRNATTVHPRTEFAVPALLTGRMPGELPFTATDAPQNLFSLAGRAGVELAIFEPVSRMAPHARPGHLRNYGGQEWLKSMSSALRAVYLAAVVPEDFSERLPVIPRVWFGLPDDLEAGDWSVRTSGVLKGSDDPAETFDQFLKMLPQGGESKLCFMHVMLPHYPWAYLPDGQRSLTLNEGGTSPLGGLGDFGEDWPADPLIPRVAEQRYLLQLRDLDRRIGQLIDQLEKSGAWDESLVIITADHGVSFRAGHSRRVPDGANLPDVLSIPLFVKAPRQAAGIVTDDNVETIDILPTIADVWNLDLPDPIDGESLLSAERTPRLRKQLIFEDGETILPPLTSQRFGAVERVQRDFGNGASDRLWNSPVHPEWVGADVGMFEIINSIAGPPTQLFTAHGLFRPQEDDDGIVPCYLEGRLSLPEDAEPATLVIAIDHRIVAVTRTFDAPGLEGLWAALIPPDSIGPLPAQVRIFRVHNPDSRPAFERCAIRKSRRS